MGGRGGCWRREKERERMNMNLKEKNVFAFWKRKYPAKLMGRGNVSRNR